MGMKQQGVLGRLDCSVLTAERRGWRIPTDPTSLACFLGVMGMLWSMPDLLLMCTASEAGWSAEPCCRAQPQPVIGKYRRFNDLCTLRSRPACSLCCHCHQHPEVRCDHAVVRRQVDCAATASGRAVPVMQGMPFAEELLCCVILLHAWLLVHGHCEAVPSQSSATDTADRRWWMMASVCVEPSLPSSIISYWLAVVSFIDLQVTAAC